MNTFITILLVCVVSGVFGAPGYIGGYAPAVSHVERVDIHNSAPVGHIGYPIGHIGHQTGHIGHIGQSYGHYGYPPAHSYSNRIDVHSPSYVRPVIEHGYGYGGLGGLGGLGGHGGLGGLGGHGGLGGLGGYGSYGGYGLHDGSGHGYAVHGYGVQGLHHGY